MVKVGISILVKTKRPHTDVFWSKTLKKTKLNILSTFENFLFKRALNVEVFFYINDDTQSEISQVNYLNFKKADELLIEWTVVSRSCPLRKICEVKFVR